MSSRSYQGKDDERVLSFNDSISNASAVIGTTHRKIHQSGMRTFTTVFLVGAAPAKVGIRAYFDSVPGTGEPVHIRPKINKGGFLADGVFRIYEDPIFSATSGPSLPFNRNRNGTDSNLDYSFDAATIFTSGNIIFETLINDVNEFRALEWILDISSLDGYYFEIENVSTNAFFASIQLDYYSEPEGQSVQVPT